MAEQKEQAKEVREEIQVNPTEFFGERTRADSFLYSGYQTRPYNPDALFQKRGNYDLMDEMREDDQINGLLTLIKLMIIGKWEIVSENDDIKEFFEWNLNNRLDELFDKKLYNILSGVDYGFSLTEKVFKYDNTPKWGKKIVVDKLKTRAPHTFEIDTDDMGNVILIRQDTQKEELKLDPDKFIHYVHRKEFDNPYGESEISKIGVYRAWFSKDVLIKFWNIALEKYGMPTAVGTYPKTDKGMKNEFLKILKNIQAKSAASIPEGFTIDLLESTNVKGGGGYEVAIDKYEQMISKSMLVPGKMDLSGGESQGGSYALGVEQFGLFYTLRNNDKLLLENLINRELIYPLTKMNFGANEQAEFKFIQVNDSKKEKQYSKWLEAVKTGKFDPTWEQKNHFMNGIDFPEFDEKAMAEADEIKEENRELNKQKMQGGNSPDDNKENNKGDKKEGSKDEKTEPKKEDKKLDKKSDDTKIKKHADKYYRALTSFEKRSNFRLIESETDKLFNTYIESLGGLYKLQINSLIEDIRRNKIVEKKKISSVNNLKLKHQKQIDSALVQMTKDAYLLGRASAKAIEQMKKFVVETPAQLTDEETAEWLKENAFYVSSMESGFILGQVKPIISESIRNGLSNKEIAKQIDDALQGYDIEVVNDAGKVVQTRALRIENIVRTTTAKAFNEGRANEFRNMDGITAYQYSAILDNRTSAICEKLDGLIFKPAELNYYNPPNHFMCRSVVVPIFEGEEFQYGTAPATEEYKGDFLKLTKEPKE
jgi:SPP1 gp7 family putative phage head morphogenesis protein